MKTFSRLMEEILTVCPDAELEEDMEGQIVVYTGLREVRTQDPTKPGGFEMVVVPFEPTDDAP